MSEPSSPAQISPGLSLCCSQSRREQLSYLSTFVPAAIYLGITSSFYCVLLCYTCCMCSLGVSVCTYVLTGTLHPPICFDPACYARWHMSWVCALCNLCILLTRDLTPPPSHWLHGYRDMLGVINQPNAKQMWKLMCLYNLNELYFVTFLEKQILQIKYLGEICVTTIIFICVPLSMFSIILSTSTSI